MSFTLPAATGAGSLTDPATTVAQQKTNLTNLRGFIAEMLSTDSSDRAAARSLLGVDAPTVTFAVGSSALTIALKSPAGADATAAAPITIPFRSATLSSGALAVRKVTAALSLVISSGSTLGQTSGQAAWLYVYALDNAGSVELAASQAYYGTSFIGSTTAEGGAGAADSASAIYSTTARSNVAMRLICVARNSQATAGTWASVPTEVRVADLLDLAPNKLLQTQSTVTSAVATGTTAIPSDDTIPQNTEGDQYMSQAITPKDALSLLEVEVVMYISASGVGEMCVALFQDSTANALAAQGATVGTGYAACITLRHIMLAGTTSSTTFKVRAGQASGGTNTFNGQGGTRKYGGVMSSRITVRELGVL